MADQLYSLTVEDTKYGLLLDPSHVAGVTELLSTSLGGPVALQPVELKITDPQTLSALLLEIGQARAAPHAA